MSIPDIGYLIATKLKIICLLIKYWMYDHLGGSVLPLSNHKIILVGFVNNSHFMHV